MTKVIKNQNRGAVLALAFDDICNSTERLHEVAEEALHSPNMPAEAEAELFNLQIAMHEVETRIELALMAAAVPEVVRD